MYDTFDIKPTVRLDKVVAKVRNRYFGYCAELEDQSTQDLRYYTYDFEETSHFDSEKMKFEAKEIDKYLVEGRAHEIVSPRLTMRL